MQAKAKESLLDHLFVLLIELNEQLFDFFRAHLYHLPLQPGSRHNAPKMAGIARAHIIANSARDRRSFGTSFKLVQILNLWHGLATEILKCMM